MARPPSALSKFIVSLPRDLSAEEVIAKAKARGMKVTESNVYRVRRLFNAKADAVTPVETRRAAIPRRGASIARPIASTSSAEDLLRALGAEIGLGRAVGILTEERARLRALIGE